MPLKDFEILHRCVFGAAHPRPTQTKTMRRNRLGKGSFGTVYKCRRVSDRKIYAMKRVDISRLKDSEIADALTEIRVLASIRHRNVCAFLEAFVERGRELVMVLDFCDGGDLATVVESARKARRLLGEAKIWNYAVQIIDGLHCLHVPRASPLFFLFGRGRRPTGAPAGRAHRPPRHQARQLLSDRARRAPHRRPQRIQDL